MFTSKIIAGFLNKKHHFIFLYFCIFIFVVILCIYSKKYFYTSNSTVSLTSDTSESIAIKVDSNDEAIRSYLKMAQIHAEIYRYTNNNRYSGLCEQSKSLYTLEGGILKYIKSVGATEVFCSTADTEYLIEAQLPKNKNFYCIDSIGNSVEQLSTKEGSQSCK